MRTQMSYIEVRVEEWWDNELFYSLEGQISSVPISYTMIPLFLGLDCTKLKVSSDKPWGR